MSDKTAAQRCQAIIQLLRVGMEAQAHSELARLMEALLPYLQRHANDMGPAEVALINNMVEAQSRGDSLFLADLLQYELPQTKLAGFVEEG